MNENSKSRKHRYNKRKRSGADKLHDLERNIDSSKSIKVTIMNDLNTKVCDSVMYENESGKSDIDGGGAEDNTFLLKVIFSNNKRYSELKTNVFNSIKNGLNGKHLIMVENDDKNLIEIFENSDEDPQIDRKSNKMRAGDDLFTIDTEPEKQSNKSKVIEIPVYTKDKFTSVMLMAESTKKKSDIPNKSRSSGMSCFNCGENHNLKDCQKPRNHAKIQQRVTKLKGGERYHIELNQKYANVVPGKLSKELRDALGLRKNEIPSHVYRMRLFGYPPGWLEDHKISNSGLTLFDSDGKTVVGDSDEEQGEIVEKVQYDLNKVIEFPGFNVPPTKESQYDDFHRNKVPPLSVNHSKEAMISFLSDKLMTPYKRKKLLNFPGANTKTDDNNVEEQCMEIEDDDDFCGPMLPPGTQPPLPDEDISGCNAPPPPPPPPPNNTKSDSEESGEITSDEDEEQNKKEETLSSLNVIPVSTTDPSSKSVKPSTVVGLETDLPDETSEMNLCNTKFETNGTPLLQFSPYTSLPSGDKFSVGVSDVINFENLPDSTGKYETMKEIIKRVRNQMDKMHGELC